MNKKHEYVLTVNTNKKESETYPFHYGSVNDAVIELYENGFRIVIRTSAKIDAEMILNNKKPIFDRAITKTLILHLVKYSKAITVNSFSFACDGAVQRLNAESFPISCIIKGSLKEPFSEKWDSEVVSDFILEYNEVYRKPKEVEDPDYIQKWKRRIMASIVSLITAKSKQNEYEKFIYLWMSMNGLYGYTAQLYEPSGKKSRIGNKNRLSEIDEMAVLWQLEELHVAGSELLIPNKRDRKIASDKAVNILARIDIRDIATDGLKQQLFEKEIAISISECLHNYPKDERIKIVKSTISAKTYLLFLLPYYLRCTYFHANKPFPLVAKYDDKIIKTLYIVNIIIEDFLDDTLVKWLDPKGIVSNYYPRFESLVYGKTIQ